MSVNYDLYETPIPDMEGEVLPSHARVVLKGSYTAEEIADQVVAFQRMKTINKAQKGQKQVVLLKIRKII